MRIECLGLCIATVLSIFCSPGIAQDQELSRFAKQLEEGNLEEKIDAARILGEAGPAAASGIPSLLKSLKSDDVGLRYEAIVSLGRINANSRDVVPALTTLLADSLPLIRHTAIDALIRFGPDATSAISGLQSLLNDDEPLIRVGAAHAIVEIELGRGTDVSAVIPILISGLKHDRPDVTSEAVQGLAKIGEPAVSAIQELLGDTDLDASSHACVALAAIGPNAAKSVDRLMKAAKSSNPSLRWHALSALGDIGIAAKSSVPILVAALDDPDGHVRFSAGQSLRKMGKVSIPALVEGLKTEKSQRGILPVITEIGTEASEATEALSRLLESKDQEIRRDAVLALAAIGPAAKSTTPVLIKLLDDKRFSYRPSAAFALGRLGAKDAVATLKTGLGESNPTVLRLACIWALLQLEPANEEYVTIGLPLLTEALKNERPEIRREAALALGHMGSRAKSAVEGLRSRLTDKDPGVRRESLIALAEIGPESQSAVSEILALLKEGDASIRPVACYALGRIGAPSKPAVPQLHRLLLSHDSHEKTLAAWALVHIEPDPESISVAIPLLAKALHGSPNPKIRIEAAMTLGRIGSTSATAKEALQFAVNDSDSDVKKAAETAIRQWK